MDLAEAAQAALELVGKVGGVEHAEVRAGTEEHESVDVRDDRVDGVTRDVSRGVGIRVLSGGGWGFAATSTLTAASLRATVERAVDIARASASVRRDDLPVTLDDTPPVTGSYVTPHRQDPFAVPLPDKVELLIAATSAAREAAGLTYAEASTDAWKRRTVLRTLAGTSIDQTVLQVGAGVSAYAIGGGEVARRSYPSSFRGQFFTGGWEDILALDLTGHGQRTGTEAVALLTAPDLPHRENATIILESSQLALQVHESVGHPTELDRILGWEKAFAGGSFVTVADLDTLQYGSDLITIQADATTPLAMGTFGWDDEGIPAGSEPIITDGVLTGFLSSRETAAAIGRRSNGTARADSWSTIPLVRMNNVSLLPGAADVTVDDLVADTADGFLLVTNRSWSIDDRRSNFQFGCEAAYEIRHGELGQLYRNPTYSGMTLDFWRSCDALGGARDWKVWGIPNCGKGQPMQVARVAHGAPTGRFRATVGAR
jgi:TldD protein